MEVGEGDTDAWERAGLYDPAAPGAADRLALLVYLTERGATVEQMLEAHVLGALPGVAADLVTRGLTSTLSVREISARSGVDEPDVLRLLLAAGIPAQPDTELPVEFLELTEAFKAGASLMGTEPILAFTRVLGAAANNVAESAIALFFAEFGPGSVREGPDELSRARISEAATRAFVAVPDVLARMVLEAFERAQRRSQLARPWSEPGAPDTGGAEGPTEIVALGFVDLVGSTAWAQSLGLREQSLALTRFESAAWSSAVLAGGRVVKMIGDEVFFAAPTAAAACRIGLEVCEAAAADQVLPPARGAVGIGPATPREGDYFGPMVNLLSRLVKTAAPGELVVTEAVVNVLSPEEWSLRPLEPTLVRGVERLVPSFHVEHRAPAR
jgi:adenylate cyclase